MADLLLGPRLLAEREHAFREHLQILDAVLV